MITTSKLLLPSLIAASEGPAQKPRNPSESKGMFNDVCDSGEEEVDKDDAFPLHISMASRGSKPSKSGQVSSVCIYFTDVILNLFPQHPCKCDAA